MKGARSRPEVIDLSQPDDEVIDLSPSSPSNEPEEPTAPGTPTSVHEQWRKSAVLRIEVVNFMTYSHCVTTPGPRLNLIVGPNGSGKSSLVCALCVGLGGATKLLGRADKVCDYIKRGCDWGMVTIHLFSGTPGEPFIISRKIRKDNTSEWRINGALSSQKKVDEAMKEFRVQLDNLTQFLPQDKVCTFAQMDGVQLLKTTEKSLNDKTLYERHERLTEMRNGIRAKETTVSQYEDSLSRLREQNAALEHDISRFQQRETFMKEAREMEKKVPWLKYEERQREMVECRDKLALVKENLEIKKKEVAALERPIKHKKVAADVAKKEATALSKKADLAEKKMQECENKVNKAFKTFSEVNEKISSFERKRKEALAKTKRLESELAALEEEIANTPSVQEEAAELAPLKKEHEKIYKQDRDLLSKIEVINGDIRLPSVQLEHHRKRLQEISGARFQRLRAMSQRLNIDFEGAERWLAENRHHFKSEVYGPIGAEIKVENAAHAKYLEQHVPRWCWSMYVATNPEDHQLLSQVKKFKANVVSYAGDVRAQVNHPDGEASSYAQYGITHTLDQVFDAPNIIKLVLTENAQINRVYCGTAATEQKIDSLMDKEKKIDRLFTPTNNYMKVKSRYSADVSWNVVHVRDSRMFTTGAGSEGREILEGKIAELQNVLHTLEQKIGALEKERGPLREQLDALNRQIQAIDRERKEKMMRARDLRSKMKTKKTLLQTAQHAYEKIDDAAKEKLVKEASVFAEKMVTLMKNLTNLYSDRFSLKEEVAIATMTSAEYKGQYEALSDDFKEEQVALKTYETQERQLQDILRGIRDMVKEAKKEAEQATGPMTEEMANAFKKMPEGVAELEEAINDLKERANGILCQNENVLVEYQRRTKEIEELERKFKAESSDLNEVKTRIDAEKQLWLPKLKELVERISVSFTAKFKEVGCAGEVVLVEAENDAFDRFEIQIRVKFREAEELAALGANRQSGGERSVSTVMYLLSLQDLTACPFRVVDEINQGMDPTNERRMFNQMVVAATQPGTPQCFILTPKLLPGLPYSRDVTLLCIFTGPWISEVSKMWNGAERKKLKAASTVV